MASEVSSEAALGLQMQCNDGSWVDIDADYVFSREEIEATKARFQRYAKADPERSYRITVLLRVVTNDIITL